MKTTYLSEIVNQREKGRRSFRRTKILGNINDANINLPDVDLEGSKFVCWSTLASSNFQGANLAFVDFNSDSLAHADLRNANLHGANLVGCDLRHTKLEGANLTKTIISPWAQPAPPTTKEIKWVGLTRCGDLLWGWRTKRSQVVGYEVYKPWYLYYPHVFSVDKRMSCHPGIYFASAKWLSEYYCHLPRVRCVTHIKDVVIAGNKARTRRLLVVPYNHRVTDNMPELKPRKR